MWLTNAAIKEGKIFSGVIALESATFIHGLSNYPPNPLILFSNSDKTLTTKMLVLLPVPSSIPIHEDLDKLNGNLYVTNKERTICELILNESNEEFIYDSIQTYLTEQPKEQATQMLLCYAEKYGCTDKMHDYINTLEDYLSGV